MEKIIKAFNTIDIGIQVDPMKYGCTDDIVNYCEKDETKDGEPFEIGTYEIRWKGKGARNDLNCFKKAIENETPRKKMYDMFFDEMSRHRNAYFDYKTCLQKEKMMNMIRVQMDSDKPLGMKTKIYYGEGNVGKTFNSLKELLSKKDFWFINFNNEHIYRDWETDRKSTRLNSSHSRASRMPSSA